MSSANAAIYLDHAATTPLDPEVRDAMLPFLGGAFGNPSSVHQAGQRVRRAVDAARDQVAAVLGCEASEVYFTSGGTESDNTAILGALLAARRHGGRDHLVTTTAEHHAVLDCARFAAETLGFRATYVPVDGQGFVDPDAIAAALTDHTALVSVMHANNEVGAVQPVAEIARRAHERGALFHTDAVQTLGQLPLDVETLGADFLTVSAHKIYGPKGAGALYARRGARWVAWLHGGQQEREKRAGTENPAAIVGFGKAAELLPSWRDTTARRLAVLRDAFVAAVLAAVPDASVNGPRAGARLPNMANLSFPGADGETLLLGLDLRGVAASSGSACSSGSIEPSHVLRALGLPPEVARTAVRFSLGRGTTEEQLTQVVSVLRDVVGSARAGRV